MTDYNDDADRALECLDGPKGCEGPITLAWPGYGSQRWPRCEKHADARLLREHENRIKYFGPEPADFSPDDAGESWDDDEPSDADGRL